jgi:hypothetical protein
MGKRAVLRRSHAAGVWKVTCWLDPMVQESLNNVIQHAGAQHAWVELEFTGTDLSV